MTNIATFRSQREINQAAQLTVDEDQFEAGKLPLDEFIERNFDALYEKHYQDMPYGTMKARDGDPHQWLADHYSGIENDVHSMADRLMDERRDADL